MAERRMFTKKITDDDNFVSLSASAQALYFQLSMSADDDGFCNQVSASMFKSHASVQDLESLLSKRYLFQFENGVIVIKHWRMANALRKDRYTPTVFQEELKQLKIKENGAYTFSDEGTWLPDGCQMVAERLPQDRLDKESIDKDNNKRFTPPTVEEVKAYCQERNNGIDAEAFVSFYESKGWLIGKNKMKDWKAAVRTWERSRQTEGKDKKKKFDDFNQRKYDFSELERLANGT